MKRVAIAIVLALVAGSAPCMATDKTPRPAHLYGEQPDWANYRRIAEAAVIAQLIDPDSARITWLSGIYKGELKPFLGTRVAGYWACGSVNAKNRMGGYTGGHTFMIAIDYGRVLSLDQDERGGGMDDIVCAKELSEGIFPPPPVSDAGDNASAARAPISGGTVTSAADVRTGLAVRAMPDGAYVSAVVPGSPAAVAGLKPGMVIASVNAVPLAGMGEAMLKVVAAAGADVMFGVIGGASVRLKPAR